MKACHHQKPGLVLCLCLLCLAACARLPAPPPGDRPVVRSAQDLLQQLEARAEDIQSFRARGHVAVVSPQRSFSGNALLTKQKPDQIRVDVVNFWGHPVVAFITSDQEIKFMVYPEGKLYRGPATTTNLARFIPLLVSLEDFMAFLTGGIAFEHYGDPLLTEAKTADFYYLELSSRLRDERVRLTVEAQTLNIVAAQWQDSQGQDLLQAEFGQFITQGQISGPREVTLSSGDRNTQLRVRYRDLTYNAPLSPGAFELAVTGAVQELSFPQ
ncbi:MAG: DUF4292 domain-containing protein [Deltaproteobacteria bacterium]|nr:DUF4292 domain-containing protein [Deltaproteobacteria bacterium]